MKNNKNQDFESETEELTPQDIKEIKEKMLSSLSPSVNKQSDKQSDKQSEVNKTMKTGTKERKNNYLSIPFDINVIIVAAGILIIIAILFHLIKQQEETKKQKEKEKEKQKIEHERAPKPYDVFTNPNIVWV